MRVTITTSVSGNLKDYRKILLGQITGGLTGVGKILQRGVRARVKEWQGYEKRGVKFEVRGEGLNKEVFVYGELVQHFIDELGLPPGTFPPTQPGTPLYRWAAAKAGSWDPTQRRASGARFLSHVHSRRPDNRSAIANAAKARKTRRAAAKRSRTGKTVATARARPTSRTRNREAAIRSIAFVVARAIYESGIKAGRPFVTTLNANRARVLQEVTNAIRRAVNEINR